MAKGQMRSNKEKKKPKAEKPKADAASASNFSIGVDKRKTAGPGKKAR